MVLWDVRSHSRLETLNAHAGAISSVAFSPRGTLAAADTDGTVVLWDVHTRRALGTPLNSHTGLLNSVAFSPGGLILAAGSGDHAILTLWNVQRHSQIRKLSAGGAGPINTVSFSPRGHTIAAGNGHGTVELWKLQNHPTRSTLNARTGQVFGVASVLTDASSPPEGSTQRPACGGGTPCGATNRPSCQPTDLDRATLGKATARSCSQTSNLEAGAALGLRTGRVEKQVSSAIAATRA